MATHKESITDKLVVPLVSEIKKSEITYRNRTCCPRLIGRAYLKLIEKGTVEVALVAGG
jgi:hypothetical protein